MSEPRIVSLADRHGTVAIEPNYHVELPDTEHFIVGAGATYPEAATGFDHPSMAARQDKVFCTRAYWPDGRKKWFEHVGRDFHFVIPRSKIALVFEKGYSYVPVIISGRRFRFNVSGGTCDGWTDFVRKEAHVGIGFTKAKLKLLAEVAVPPRDCKVSFDLMEMPPEDSANFLTLMAGHVCRKQLAEGHEVFLKQGWTFDEHQGPFLVESKPRKCRYYIATTGLHKIRVGYSAIDWTRTADANGFEVLGPTTENRVGLVKPYSNPTLRVG